MTKSNANLRGSPLLAAVLAVVTANAMDCEVGSPAQGVQARQKIKLLERLTRDSEPLRRLQATGDEAALATIDNARAIMESANQALADGCEADAAALSNDALRLATEAFRNTSAVKRDGRNEFDAELGQARSFLASLQGRPAAESGLDDAAIAGIERQLRNAEAMAASGSVKEARELLMPVNDRLRRRLLELFDQRTIYYEHNFETPADEYAYLVQQYDGYIMLLRSGQKTTPYSARKRVTDMLDNALMQRERAKAFETASEWNEAIASMNAALEYCEHATRATGYSY